MSELIKAKIIQDGETKRYFDREGNELHDGDQVRFDKEATISGEPMLLNLYLTDEGELGVDATNPAWIEKGLAVPCEYGIYPLTEDNLKYATRIRGKA